MERRTLGKTGLEVSVLGFGAAEIGYMGVELPEVERMLNAALDAGLNVIDTAASYVDSEEKIGKAVRHRRNEFHLFTKCGHTFQGAPEMPAWDPEFLRLSLENSLEKLQTDHVDLLQLHSCGLEVLEAGDVLAFMLEAKESGKTRFIGYSGDGRAAAYALSLGLFDTLQTSCNIADQECIDLLLPEAKRQNVGVIVKRPVANVAWHNGDQPPTRAYANTYWERLRTLQYPFLDAPLEEAFETALRFTLSQDIATMIVGTTKPGRWESNAKIVGKGRLSAEALQDIRDQWASVAPRDWVGQT